MDNTTPIQSVLGDRITLPYLFKKNGYHTVSLGKIFHSEAAFNDLKAWDELYDQLNDPMEYNNLADNPRYSQIVDFMKTRLHADY